VEAVHRQVVGGEVDALAGVEALDQVRHHLVRVRVRVGVGRDRARVRDRVRAS